MRLIGTLPNERMAARIVFYFKQKGIDAQTEQTADDKGAVIYQIWVMDEDRLNEAASYFQQFAKGPSDPEFDAPPLASSEIPIEEEEPRKKATPLTLFLIIVCSFIFFLNYSQELSEKSTFTSIQKLLLYDFIPGDFENLQYFRGFFDWFIIKIQGLSTFVVEGPLFTKIRQGEIWRLFTPAILHTQFLHLFFNMIWLWILGKPIEEKIGIVKTLILTVLLGISSNTLQYLASGPLFFGYSGVVMGLAGFIWMRKKKFPWEGYLIHKSTFLFLVLFVGAIFALSLLSFFAELWLGFAIPSGIANTAHITGGIVGVLLGRSSLFTGVLTK